MAGGVHLLAYADRLGGDLPRLRRLLTQGPLSAFSGIHVLPFFLPYDRAAVCRSPRAVSRTVPAAWFGRRSCPPRSTSTSATRPRRTTCGASRGVLSLVRLRSRFPAFGGTFDHRVLSPSRLELIWRSGEHAASLEVGVHPDAPVFRLPLSSGAAVRHFSSVADLATASAADLTARAPLP